MLPQVYEEYSLENIEDTLNEELPLLREYFFDLKTGSLVYENGKPKIVSDIDALKIHIYKMLITERFKFLGYSWDYGCELNSLIGNVQSHSVVEAESKRLIEECLLVNPYITSIDKVQVSIDGKKVNIVATINTIYGEVEINV